MSASGHQPLSNEDQTLWIAYNGEIYDYQELRAQLIGRGHRFQSQSDTEVIVHLYEEYGARCLDHLHGMFAFAIWDARARRLFIARDCFDIKPLCFGWLGDWVIRTAALRTSLRPPGDAEDI